MRAGGWNLGVASLSTSLNNRQNQRYASALLKDLFYKELNKYTRAILIF
jgi:hypothetical protein